ncbi:Phage-related minor tail protein [Vibrio ruber DSM 16370]|uniref:Phage-related minor tail protein n=1 Tax=Vibrio ruber (strain DSM 16370 / JCM 11486 / BCRC 17186 / CECT 7878 / LMG 23124 / VR1) TaxID=1123498 RepID=A0A1R4LKP2_VIBR1|nr:phage tail tape measure protein [Vibrio ruber]SJN56989.1 Phage-related minor tail protein [Vibrio ruber DSM 16370]
MADSTITTQVTVIPRQKTMENLVDKLPSAGDVKAEVVSAVTPILKPLKQAVTYERSFADVKKSVHFASDQEANQYQGKMQHLAGQLGVKQANINQIVSDGAQSGIGKEQLLSFAESVSKVAVVWNVSAREATETLARWRTSMQLSQQQAVGLANATNALSHSMGVKAKSVAAVVSEQGDTGLNAGLNVQQTAALSASLLAGGASEKQAGEAIHSILGTLTAGKADKVQQQAAMKTLDIEPADLAHRMQTDAQGTLIDVFQRLKNVSAEKRQGVVSDLFGDKSTAAILKLVDNLDQNNKGFIAASKLTAEKSNYSNSIGSDYKTVSNTSAYKLAQLSARFEQISITLGEGLLPVVETMLPPLLTVVDSMSAFAQTNPKLATGLLAVTAAAIPLLKVGSTVVNFFRGMKGGGKDRLNPERNLFAGGLDRTRQAARRATRQLARLNRELNALGSQQGSDAGYGDDRESRRKRKKNPRKRSRFRRRFAGSFRRKSARFGQLLTRFPRVVGNVFKGAKLKSGISSLMPKAGAVAKGNGIGKRLFSARTAGKMFSGVKLKSGISSLMPKAGAVFKGLGRKLFRPLDMALNGVELVSAIAKGNPKKIAGKAGDLLGGMGGAASGAMAGAAIGSVVPILGTAVGGLIGSVVGGLGGSEVGRWLGDTVGSLFGASDESNDKQDPSQRNSSKPNSSKKHASKQDPLKKQRGISLKSLGGIAMKGASFLSLGGMLGGMLSDQVVSWFGEDKTDKAAPATVAEQSKKLEKSTQQQINFAPVIHITPSGNPTYDQGVSQQLLERMKAELSPILMGNNDVATRADASLLDRSNT